jgi:hypothetical protein
VSAIVDSERLQEDAAPAADRSAFEVCCRAVGIDLLITKRRATENYFSERAIKAALGEQYSALGEYGALKPTATMRSVWSKSDNWRIARELSWDEIKDTDVGVFLKALSG